MTPHPRLGPRRAVWTLLAAAALSVAIFPRFAVARKHRPSAWTPQAFQAYKPQLLHAKTNPTLRFPVAYNYHLVSQSLSYGWLDISQTSVRYIPEQPADQRQNGFVMARNKTLKTKIDPASFLKLYSPDKKAGLFYVPECDWGKIHTGMFSNDVVRNASLNGGGTVTIQEAIEHFNRLLALARPAPPPAPVVRLIVAPLTVEKGRPVTLSWTSTHSTSADLEPGVGKVSPTGTTSVTATQTTDYILTATGPGGSVSAKAHVTVKAPPPNSPPTLIVTDPALGASGQTVEVHKAMFSIRGVATDQAGLPTVRVNGVDAIMRPRDAHSAEFWSDPAELRAGANKFQIVATGPKGEDTHFDFTARYVPAVTSAPAARTAPAATHSQALSLQDILDLLKNYVPSQRVEGLVKQFGVKFRPTAQDLKALRAAGADDDLVDAVLLASQAAHP